MTDECGEDDEGLFVQEVAAASRAKDRKTDTSINFGLEYFNEIVREHLTKDHLSVIAKGLGLHKAAAALIYCVDVAGTQRYGAGTQAFASENLVIILNAGSRDTEAITDYFEIFEQQLNLPSRGIVVVNKDITAAKRAALYEKGGVFAATSRVFTVDMITKTIDPKKITGLIILNAHSVGPNSKEAFIVKLLRAQNSDAFIKALTDEPRRVSRGINGLPNRLKSLGVKQVSLWPRFRFEVSKCLNGRDLEEVILEMDERTMSIQSLLQDIIQSCISQIKRNIKAIDTESWNVDAAFSGNLHRTIRLELDSVYHKLSSEARQAISDLESLQKLLHMLCNYHPADWNYEAEAIRMVSSRGKMPSLWLTLPAADAMYDISKQRINNGDVPGKWNAIVDLLRALNGKRTLIMCSDGRTMMRLRQLITFEDNLSSQLQIRATEQLVRLRAANHTINASDSSKENSPAPMLQGGSEQRRNGDPQNKPPPSKRRRVRGGGAATAPRLDVSEISPRQLLPIDTDGLQYFEGMPVNEVRYRNGSPNFDELSTPYTELDQAEEHTSLPCSGEIVLCTYDIAEILERFRPDAVIMYEPNLQFTRELETYQACYNPIDVIHFMYYQRSVEELMYLTDLRKEKDAFTSLIREKGSMPMVIEDDFHRQGDGELRVVNTRLAGGQTRTDVFNETEKIVVDAREFMSDLPFLIWQQGIDIIPLQLEVGDYVLTPECVVERKSISDLLSSFKDGRLFEQCTKMFNFYTKPILLIEFDGEKAFSFDQFRDAQKAGARLVHERLTVILLLFPKLKIIWSSSQRNTAEIFQSIKYDRKQPDPQSCAAVGRKVMVNHAALDVLRAIPGVSAATAPLIAERLGCLADLAELSLQDLTQIVGSENAKQIVTFLDKRL